MDAGWEEGLIIQPQEELFPYLALPLPSSIVPLSAVKVVELLQYTWSSSAGSTPFIMSCPLLKSLPAGVKLFR